MIQTGVALLFQAGIFLQQLNHLRPRHARFVVFDHPAEVRHVERPAANHHRIAAGDGHTILGALPVPDLAVGHHRNGQTLADLTDRLPVNAFGFVAIFFGAAVNHQLAGPGLLHRIGDFEAPFAAVPAESHLDGHRQMIGNRFAHGFRTAIDQLRIFQQRRPAAAAVHQLRRTAAV